MDCALPTALCFALAAPRGELPVGAKGQTLAWAEAHLFPLKPKRQRQPRTGVSHGQKFRLELTHEQAGLLRQWIGACRWWWNHMLAAQQAHYAAHGEHLSTIELSKQLTDLRKRPDMAWLNEVPRTVLAQVGLHLNQAWSNYFDGRSGKRKGTPPGQPQFRKHGGSRETATFQVDHRLSSPLDLIDGRHPEGGGPGPGSRGHP